MTAEQKATFLAMADALDEEIKTLRAKGLGNMQRELSIAFTKIEEAAMWIRRSVDVAPA